jgi:hypothetical protein
MRETSVDGRKISFSDGSCSSRTSDKSANVYIHICIYVFSIYQAYTRLVVCVEA